MGKFDAEIAWCRQRRAVAIEDIADFDAGRRQFRNNLDITDELRARAVNDIKQFDKLIAGYEALHAKGS